MATRLQLMVQEVLEALEAAGTRNVKKTRVLLALDRAQQEVCQKGMALEAEDTITLEAGTKVYELDINLFKIRSIVEPDGWCKGLRIVENSNEWRELVRNRHITATRPLYCTVWAKMFRCTPAPTVSGEDLTIFGYRLPTDALTEITLEPEVGAEWDDAMIANAIGRLLKEPVDGPHMVEFGLELERVKADSVSRTAAGAIRKQHWSDDLNF